MPAEAPTAPPERPSDAEIAARVRAEIDRTIQRTIKGLEFINAPDPAVGLTPKDVIHSRGTLELYHYRPMADEVYRVPVLLIMSLVSKAYIMDLAPGQSLVEFLLKCGFDVFMIDWGVPRPQDSRLKLDDYVLDFLPECIAKATAAAGEPDISVLGYCMGGDLAIEYAALHAGGPLKNLICCATPVDYDGMVLQRKFADPRYFDVDRLVDAIGNIPPEMMVQSFEMLRPVSKSVGNLKLWDNMWDDEFVRNYRLFDRWGSDQIPFPGECFRQTTKELMWANKLAKNELVLGGRRVDLRNITVPLLNVMAEHDHIAPYDSVKPLINLVGSEDKQDIVLKGGHVSLMAGPNAVRRLWPQIDAWLSVRSL